MKVILFGVTGMVGQGVLRECLLNPDVQLVQTIGRNAAGRGHQKLREIVRQNLFDYSDTGLISRVSMHASSVWVFRQ